MNYYVKIIKKNDAGFFGLRTQRDSDNQPTDVITNVGYAAISSLFEEHIILPNSVINIVTCNMYQWRDGAGDPSGRGFWSVKFQIVGIDAPDYKEKAATPEYDLTGVNYADGCGLTMVLNPKISKDLDLAILVKENQKRYNEWKKATGRK